MSTTTTRSTTWSRSPTSSSVIGARSATSRSTSRSRRLFPAVCKQLARRPGRATGGRLAARCHREAVRARPRERPRAQRHRRGGLPAGLDLPDRPLPGQGDGAEHPGPALRQPAVRAGVERQLRRPRTDHHGRGHRHRRSSRLLRRHRRRARRHPEPPASAARPDRRWRSRSPSRPTPCAPRRTRSLSAVGSPRPRPAHGARSVRRGVAGRRTGHRLPRGGGIPSTPTTETFAAIRLDIDTRRWAGVPFYLRTGKRLGRRVTEVAVVFKRAPHLPFEAQPPRSFGENALVIRVQPDEGVTIRFGSKVPGTQMEVRDVTMDFGYGTAFTEASPEAYERLILDVLLGEPPLFPRHAEVELSWNILDPIEDYWATHGRPSPTPPARGARHRPTRCWPVTDEPGDDHDHQPAGHHHPKVGKSPRRPAREVRRDRPWPGAHPVVVSTTSSRGRIEAANDASHEHPCRVIASRP